MAKVKFCCDSGANIHSCKDSGWIDTVEDYCMEEGEWESITEEEKYEFAEELANEYIEIYYEENGG